MQYVNALVHIPSACITSVYHTRKDVAKSICYKFYIHRYSTDCRYMLSNSDVSCVHGYIPYAILDEINPGGNTILTDKHVYADKSLYTSTKVTWNFSLLARKHKMLQRANTLFYFIYKQLYEVTDDRVYIIQQRLLYSMYLMLLQYFKCKYLFYTI